LDLRYPKATPGGGISAGQGGEFLLNIQKRSVHLQAVQVFLQQAAGMFPFARM
jgi:hypothetical protein